MVAALPCHPVWYTSWCSVGLIIVRYLLATLMLAANLTLLCISYRSWLGHFGQRPLLFCFRFVLVCFPSPLVALPLFAIWRYWDGVRRLAYQFILAAIVQLCCCLFVSVFKFIRH